MKRKGFVIAIDGHSSCGKSTLARQLATKLSFVYVDSGAMYRAVCLHAIRNGAIKNSEPDKSMISELLEDINIYFKSDEKSYKTYLNDEDVSEEIRSMQVSALVSKISSVKIIREKLVNLQQEMAKNTSIVMDGRDIGTVVFPDADLKIFLTANEKIRAERRYAELNRKCKKIEFEKILENIRQRDLMDSSRKISPLKKAVDAKTIDNSYLSEQQQLDIAYNMFMEIYDDNRN